MRFSEEEIEPVPLILHADLPRPILAVEVATRLDEVDRPASDLGREALLPATTFG